MLRLEIKKTVCRQSDFPRLFLDWNFLIFFGIAPLLDFFTHFGGAWIPLKYPRHIDMEFVNHPIYKVKCLWIRIQINQANRPTKSNISNLKWTCLVAKFSTIFRSIKYINVQTRNRWVSIRKINKGHMNTLSKTRSERFYNKKRLMSFAVCRPKVGFFYEVFFEICDNFFSTRCCSRIKSLDCHRSNVHKRINLLWHIILNN